MELTLPAAKRIKLEHSYAVTTGTIRIECPEVEEEDPLKICPEDFAIKVENEEDIVIKQEELGDVDANQSVEYFNLPNISQQLENHSHAHNTTLLPDEENDSVNNETDCLELEDNCDITVKMDPFILENDMVPKQVFLEFQQNYEKTIRDLKTQNERILSVAERVTKENGEVLQGTLVNSPSFDQQTLQTHAELVNEITRLKDELRESKSKEALLETKVNIRGQSLEITRKSMKLLEKRCSDEAKAKKMYIDEIRTLKACLNETETQLACLERQRTVFKTIRKDNSELKDLKAQLSAKDVELKKSAGICKLLASKLTGLGKEYASQKSLLQKLQQDLHNKGKELTDSIRIRQILTDRSVRLSNKLRELTISYEHNLKKMKVELMPKKHAEELEKLIDVERKKNSYLVKERDQLLAEQQVKYRQIQKHLFHAKQELSAESTLLRNKIKESEYLNDRYRKLCMQFKLNEKELKAKVEEIQKKDEAYRTKVCEYCSFH